MFEPSARITFRIFEKECHGWAMACQPQQQRRQPGKATSNAAWEDCKKRNSTSCHFAVCTMARGNELLEEHFDEAVNVHESAVHIFVPPMKLK
eukprot:2898182-Rhodomonas_salina.1